MRGLRLTFPLLPVCDGHGNRRTPGHRPGSQGGLNIIHKNLHAGEVRWVKRYVAGVVRDPVTVPTNWTVAQVEALAMAHVISGFPVIHADGLVAALIAAWADAVKVGIGSGSIYTT